MYMNYEKREKDLYLDKKDRVTFDRNDITPEMNVNILFNFIQAARNDVSIMSRKPEYQNIRDADIVGAAQALAREVERLFGNEV